MNLGFTVYTVALIQVNNLLPNLVIDVLFFSQKKKKKKKRINVLFDCIR